MSRSPADGTLRVAAPLGGWCASLDDSPDPVFRERILGDGASIDPTDNVVLAPFDAEVLNIPDTRHAVSLKATNGAEILIHIGIDTVTLAGNGFTAHVKVGDRVKKGQRLLSFDMDGIAHSAVSLRTPVLLLHSDAYALRRLDSSGPIRAGDALFEVIRSNDSGATTEKQAGTSGPAQSASVFVGLAHGIHARPAALLVQAIKSLDATVTCTSDAGKSANCRSAVALMALGVKHGDRITVAATGRDAAQAIAAFIPLLEPLGVPPVRKKETSQTSVPIAPPAPGSVLRAQSAGTGLAIGPAHRIRAWQATFADAPQSPAVEQASLERAIATVRQFLVALQVSQDATGRAIAEAHLTLLEDPTLAEHALADIRLGATAARAWHKAVIEASESLQKLDDRRMRERIDDLQDMNGRVQRALAGLAPGESIDLPSGAVVVAHTLLPTQLLELAGAQVAAICTAVGGTTSHVAILAASMDIPMLVAAGNAVLAIEDGSMLVVNADRGELHVEPGHAGEARIRSRIRNDVQRKQRELVAAMDECVMTDGVRIQINANVGSANDVQQALLRGADGCGLLRTEFLFMDRSDAPDVDEQQRIYQQISDALVHRPMVVRTLDAGGDKPIAYIEQDDEMNPALGIRGIRLGLRNRSLLKTQLDALSRVRRNAELKVMIPMVTSVHEVQEVRALIDDLKSIDRKTLLLGVMIETPAAALIADHLAEAAAFFSIGTNDLTQYTLAMDRSEPMLAAELDALHPAVLRLIARTAEAARNAGRPVAVCGGAAGDALAVPILIGLGIRELSMVPGLIARQKASIRELSVAECAELAKQSLSMKSAKEIRDMMREYGTRHSV